MGDGIDHLVDAIRAIAIRPPCTFTWLGSRASLPRSMRRGRSEAQLGIDLTERLARTLYAGFYQSGRPIQPRGDGGPIQPDAIFVDALSRANRGRGCSDPGWRFVERTDYGTIVTKGGLAFTIRERTSRRLTRIVLPKELPRLAPGFYMAVGNAALDDRAIARVYWHVGADGAAPLVAAATGLLNERGIPFRLKVANRPDAFDRCDAAVLYLPKRRIRRAWPLIDTIRCRVAPRLLPAVPAFTKRIAPGVAAADDPPGGESFGMARCRVVASALVAAATKKKRSIDERVAEIETAFRDRGLDLDRPYLGRDSTDVYRMLDA